MGNENGDGGPPGVRYRVIGLGEIAVLAVGSLIVLYGCTMLLLGAVETVVEFGSSGLGTACLLSVPAVLVIFLGVYAGTSVLKSTYADQDGLSLRRPMRRSRSWLWIEIDSVVVRRRPVRNGLSCFVQLAIADGSTISLPAPIWSGRGSDSDFAQKVGMLTMLWQAGRSSYGDGTGYGVTIVDEPGVAPAVDS